MYGKLCIPLLAKSMHFLLCLAELFLHFPQLVALRRAAVLQLLLGLLTQNLQLLCLGSQRCVSLCAIVESKCTPAHLSRMGRTVIVPYRPLELLLCRRSLLGFRSKLLLKRIDRLHHALQLHCINRGRPLLGFHRRRRLSFAVWRILHAGCGSS